MSLPELSESNNQNLADSDIKQRFHQRDWLLTQNAGIQHCTLHNNEWVFFLHFFVLAKDFSFHQKALPLIVLKGSGTSSLKVLTTSGFMLMLKADKVVRAGQAITRQKFQILSCSSKRPSNLDQVSIEISPSQERCAIVKSQGLLSMSYVVNIMIFQPFLLQHTQKSMKLHNFCMIMSEIT